MQLITLIYTLNVLMGLMTAMSTNYFLSQLSIGVKNWLLVNCCAWAGITHIVGTVLAFKRIIPSFFITVAVLPLMFYGTMGLFVLPWGGMNNFAQVNHLFMTASWIVSVLYMMNVSDWYGLSMGLLLSIIFFVPLIAKQQAIVHRDWAFYSGLMNGEHIDEELINIERMPDDEGESKDPTYEPNESDESDESETEILEMVDQGEVEPIIEQLQ
ncbi:hypothetical protein PCE1_000306 [Barthelona sp. PCE]